MYKFLLPSAAKGRVLLKRKETFMNKQHIIRAWKDRAYRQSLSQEQQAILPEHPAGEIDLADGELYEVQGATIVNASVSDPNCPPIFTLVGYWCNSYQCPTTMVPLA